MIGDLLRDDRDMAVWWGTWIEGAVAISRLKREGNLDEESERETRAALDGLASDWTEIKPTDNIRLSAMILSQNHSLRAADCLQFAAALRWCEGDTSGKGFVCLDDQLRRAACDEGFDALPEVEAT